MRERDALNTETNDGIKGRGTMEDNAMRTEEEMRENDKRGSGYGRYYEDCRKFQGWRRAADDCGRGDAGQLVHQRRIYMKMEMEVAV